MEKKQNLKKCKNNDNIKVSIRIRKFLQKEILEKSSKCMKIEEKRVKKINKS